MSRPKYTREEAYRLYRKNPQEFFDQVIHHEADNEEKLINKDWPVFWTRYHYNLVENGIMEIMMEHDVPIKGANILDIGSGTGHWLEFYQTCFKPAQLWGVEFAEAPFQQLQKNYSTTASIRQWDISKPVPNSFKDLQFDLINAIGVIFHIVDDKKWKSAIANLTSILKHGGILIIGGDFGSVTRERGVMRKTRSLKQWQVLAANLDLNILDLKRFDWWAGADQDGLTNNLLTLRKN